jgi:hypothetical protein
MIKWDLTPPSARWIVLSKLCRNLKSGSALVIGLTPRPTSRFPCGSMRNPTAALPPSETSRKAFRSCKAEGALRESDNIQRRMKDLAIQATDAATTQDDRAALNAEFNELYSQPFLSDSSPAQVWRAVAAAGENTYPLASLDGAGQQINVGACVEGSSYVGAALPRVCRR